MANRYWVGGTGNWTDATNHWSDTTNGAPNASFLPTFADNVFFDANSDGAPNVAFTVTVNATANCADIDIGVASGLTQIMTLAGSAQLNVYGSWKNATSATYTRTYTGLISFNAITTSNIITTNGVIITTGIVAFNGVGGKWTLGSALTIGTGSGSGYIVLGAGTLDTDSTGNYNITTARILATGDTARGLNLNASTVSLSQEGTGLNLSGSNLTFNAGTSQINFSAATPTIIVGGYTLYNFAFTSTVTSSSTISMANGSTTFNNLTITSPTSEATGTRAVYISGNNITVKGTLTCGAANTQIRRVQFLCDVPGTQRTITFNSAASSLATLSYVDFRDIAFATSSGSLVSLPASGTKLGDGGNNSQITFDVAKTVYWTGNTNGNLSDTRWSNSSGGGTSIDYFPLAQDTAIFDQSGTPANHTVTNNRNWWIGELNFSSRSTAITFATGTVACWVFKNLTLSSAVTLTGTTGSFSFQQGAASQDLNITPAGVTFTQNIVVNINPTSNVKLLANITNSDTARSVTVSAGTLNLNSNIITYGLFSGGTGTTIRGINFGTNGTFVVSGSGASAWSVSGNNFTTSETGTINMSSASAKTFAGGGFYYAATLNQGGGGALTISGNNTFSNITNTVQPATIIFTAGSTQTVSTFTASGTSGNLVTIQSSSAGSQFTISDSSGYNSVSYCSIKDSAATGGATWQAFTSNGNVNSGNNTGWDFSAPDVVSYTAPIELRSFTERRGFN